ncbi:hypothetical protein Spb1_27500 [Planctopirus ephydatiae]|uniref:Uncharacterized protein n=1 Tax=Planctopirus ephydatiae TaxID=2528019 RepID=A0A518GQB9_9PLAN|nr:hypothetical protein Spb1_27500 [Planctopirus ephydatiae]
MTSFPAVNHKLLFNFNVESDQDLIAQSSVKFGTEHSKSDKSEFAR